MRVASIAYIPPATGSYCFIGLNSVNMTGSSSTDSYSRAVPQRTTATSGFVASNGNMNLTGNATIERAIHMLSGQSLSSSGNASFGTRKTLSSSLAWPTPSAGSYATSNNNSAIGMPTTGANLNWSGGTLNIPSGNYCLNTFNISGGTVNISSDVTIYARRQLRLLWWHDQHQQQLAREFCRENGHRRRRSGSQAVTAVCMPTSKPRLPPSITAVVETSTAG